MRIGVKFCGGCKETYSRSNFYQRIKRELKEFEFTYAAGQTEYDALLVICGCKSACASLEGLRARKGAVVITEEQDSQTVKNWLENCGKC